VAVPNVFATMSQRSWALSQDANKSSGVCSVCRATRQLHHRDGNVHKHGPRDKPCPGSNKPPLSVSQHGTSIQSQSLVSTFVSQSGSASSATVDPHPLSVWSPVKVPLIKHIPKSARPACASHLAKLLRDVVAQPSSADNWLAVANWGAFILSVPKRGGKRHNTASVIKKRIDTFRAGNITRDEPVAAEHSNKTPSTLLAQAVSAKIEDGNLQAAIRILCSEDTPAQPSKETLEMLQEKHPPASEGMADLPDICSDTPLSVSEVEVRRAVLSFPAGSSGGPDGIRPQHLKDLLACRESGADFLSALTGFVNTMLAGRCPTDLTPIFFGGRLLALNKKSGGVRPIAVGMTLRRLASKCASSYGVARMAHLLSPRQLGVGIAGGCEAAVHSARRYLQTLEPDHIMVKLDFANAFNSLHRSKMLLAIRDYLPELYAFCFSSYSQPSHLYFGSYIISSQEGPQQGDPLGPLLFCCAISPLLNSLLSDLTLGYLDDLTLAGHINTVASDVRRVVEDGRKLGLHLNPSKCEVICHSDLDISDPMLQTFTHTAITDATLLGAPLFQGSVLDNTWTDRCAELSRAVDRLSLIGAQDALMLLRISFSAPRVQHLLRCSPSVDNPALDVFDSHLRSALCRIANVDISDMEWTQASLPIRYGGLGIRKVRSLALPAYLASAASTSDLQTSILSACSCTSDSFHDSYLSLWQSTFGPLAPSPGLSGKQSFWDKPGIMAAQAQVESSISDSHQMARFLAARAPHSGDWLLAFPISSCGLRLSDEAVRVAVALRLGCSVCVAHSCFKCGTLADAQGLHGLVCKQTSSKTARHHAVNDLIARALTSAGIPVSKEPAGLNRRDGKRPDGLTLIPWQGGKPVCWDVTVISTLADSYLHTSAQTAGGAADLAASRKEAKYSDLPSSYIFQPLAFETLGPLSACTTAFVTELGRRLSQSTDDSRETAFLFQRLSVAIQRFNSVLIQETFDFSDGQPDL